MLRPVIIEQFPGVDLRSDPGDSRAAIDLLNVTIEPGRVRVRDGFGTLYITPSTETANRIEHFVFGTGQIIVQGTSNRAINVSTGALVGTALAASGVAGQDSGVAVGTPAAKFYYTCNSQHIIRRWDGATWTSPAGMPANPAVLGLSPTDNRLVVADTGSKLWFSDPGVPETFGANNFVQLTPGDGETISSIATFNNQVFVFKQTKFFVFYGNSTDSAGNPVFNYRAVAGKVGVGGALSGVVFGPSPESSCVAADGVYFFSGAGVYRTTGGQPTRVSSPIDPFFIGDSGTFTALSSFWQGGSSSVLSTGPCKITAVDSFVYLLAPTVGPGTTVLWVLDTRTGSWTCWTAAGGAGLCMSVPNTSKTPLLMVSTNVGGFGFVNWQIPGMTTDQSSSAIVSRYRLPFETYGDPRQKRIRETILEGTGTPTVKWSRDWGALSTGSAVTLGTSPAVAVNRQRLAQRGRAFSLQLGAASGAWAANRVQVNIDDELRPPGVTI